MVELKLVNLVKRVLHLDVSTLWVVFSSADEELSSPDCVSKSFSIRKDFQNESWKLGSPKSLFDHTQCMLP